MATQMYVNLPIKDLKKTVEFFSKIGFKFNPKFTNQNATCMIVGKDSFVMLLVEKFFKTFTPRHLVDAHKNTEVILSLTADSRADVDKLVEKALCYGAKTAREPQDYGWMYNRSFFDLDGHLWEIGYMNLKAMPKT